MGGEGLKICPEINPKIFPFFSPSGPFFQNFYLFFCFLGLFGGVFRVFPKFPSPPHLISKVGKNQKKKKPQIVALFKGLFFSLLFSKTFKRGILIFSKNFFRLFKKFIPGIF